MAAKVPFVATLRLLWFLADYEVIFMSPECHLGANIKVAGTYSELLCEVFRLTVWSWRKRLLHLGQPNYNYLHSWKNLNMQFG